MPVEDEQKDGENTEPKTYSEAEVAAAVETAKKEGANTSWSHFQSVADKEIAKAKSEGSARETALTETIDTMRTQHIAGLPEHERTGAMIEELYKDRHGEKSSGQAPDSKPVIKEPEFDQADAAKAMQEKIGGTLKKLGLDPDKVDWGDGKDPDKSMETFLAGVIEQAKGESKSGDESDDEKGDDKKRGEGVDISRGVGSTTDVMTSTPKDIVASIGKWEPIRGMVE